MHASVLNIAQVVDAPLIQTRYVHVGLYMHLCWTWTRRAYACTCVGHGPGGPMHAPVLDMDPAGLCMHLR